MSVTHCYGAVSPTYHVPVLDTLPPPLTVLPLRTHNRLRAASRNLSHCPGQRVAPCSARALRGLACPGLFPRSAACGRRPLARATALPVRAVRSDAQIYITYVPLHHVPCPDPARPILCWHSPARRFALPLSPPVQRLAAAPGDLSGLTPDQVTSARETWLAQYRLRTPPALSQACCLSGFNTRPGAGARESWLAQYRLRTPPAGRTSPV